MINHTINYKDLIFNITVSKDSSFVTYTENGVSNKLDLVGNSANKKQKNIICYYIKLLLDSNGDPIKGVNYPQIKVLSNNYDKIYDIDVDGTEGTFADSGLINLMLQNNTGDKNCVAFDINNGYIPFQPIIYTVDTDDTDDTTATVTVDNFEAGKTFLFSLDDTGTWQTGLIFENLSYGTHTIKAKYHDGDYEFSNTFEVVEIIE